MTNELFLLDGKLKGELTPDELVAAEFAVSSGEGNWKEWGGIPEEGVEGGTMFCFQFNEREN